MRFGRTHVPAAIKPVSFVEPDCIDDKRVPFPVPHRVTQPRWEFVRFLWMRASVHVDDLVHVRDLLKDSDDTLLLGQLKKFPRTHRRSCAWSPGRKAKHF